jgi:hypothetical protein
MEWDVHVMALSSELSRISYIIEFLKDILNPHVATIFMLT